MILTDEMLNTDFTEFEETHPNFNALNFYVEHYEEIKNKKFDNFDKEEIRYILENAAIYNVDYVSEHLINSLIINTVIFILTQGKDDASSDPTRLYEYMNTTYLMKIRLYLDFLNETGSTNIFKEIMDYEYIKGHFAWLIDDIFMVPDLFTINIKETLDGAEKIFENNSIFDKIKFLEKLRDFVKEPVPKRKVEIEIETLKQEIEDNK